MPWKRGPALPVRPCVVQLLCSCSKPVPSPVRLQALFDNAQTLTNAENFVPLCVARNRILKEHICPGTSTGGRGNYLEWDKEHEVLFCEEPVLERLGLTWRGLAARDQRLEQAGEGKWPPAHVSLLSSRCRVIDSQLLARSANQKQEPCHVTRISQSQHSNLVM